MITEINTETVDPQKQGSTGRLFCPSAKSFVDKNQGEIKFSLTTIPRQLRIDQVQL